MMYFMTIYVLTSIISLIVQFNFLNVLLLYVYTLPTILCLLLYGIDLYNKIKIDIEHSKDVDYVPTIKIIDLLYGLSVSSLPFYNIWIIITKYELLDKLIYILEMPIVKNKNIDV